LAGHGSQVWDVAFSPDGRHLATGGKLTDGVIVWDLATRREVHRFPGSAYRLAFSPDGKTLAGGGAAVRLWDVAGGRQRAALADPDLGSIVGFFPDGRTLVTTGTWFNPPGVIKLRDAESGAERSRFGVQNVLEVALSHDGRTLAVAGYGHVELWDPASGKLKATLAATGSRALAFSPDGTRLATGGVDRSVIVWDLATARPIARDVHRDEVWAVAFSPDGKTLAAASRRGEITTWDMTPAAGPVTVEVGGGNPLNDRPLVFLPDSRALVVGGGKQTRLIDAEAGRELAAVAPDSVAAASRDGRLWLARVPPDRWMVWDHAEGRERANVPGLAAHAEGFRAALSPDGGTLALYQQWRGNNAVTLRDLATGRSRTLRTELATISILQCVFSPDGKRLAAGLQHNWLAVWDVDSGGVRFRVEVGPSMAVFGSLAFTPDGSGLAAGLDSGTVKLFDARTGQLRANFSGHTRAVQALAFSPSGETIATGSDDATIRLWDVATGQERATLKGHGRPVVALAFAPDGRTLASLDAGRVLKLWRAADDSEARRGRPIHDAEDPEDPWMLLTLGDRLARAGDRAAAERLARHVEPSLLRRSEAAPTPGDFSILARGWSRLGQLWEQLGRPAEAVAPLRRARELGRRLVARSPAEPARRLDLADTDITLARALRRQGQLREGDQSRREATELLEGTADAGQPAHSRIALGHAFWRLGEEWAAADRPDAAEAAYRRALGIFERAAADFPEQAFLRQEQAFSHRYLGGIQVATGRPRDSEASYRRALELYRGLAAETRTAFYRQELAFTDRLLGGILDALGRADEAEAAYREAAGLYRGLVASDPASAVYRQELGHAVAALVPVMRRLGRPERAILVESLDLPAGGPKDANNLVWSLVSFADVPPPVAARAASLMKAAVGRQPESPHMWNTLGAAHYRAGDWPAAIEALQKSRELNGTTSLGFDGFFLAMAHWRRGDREEARRWYDRSVAWMEENAPADEELRRFRAEAAALLGRPDAMPNGEEAFAPD
jgi:WD40 repeat protein/tetratricopeptide (TPR) repeat protein